MGFSIQDIEDRRTVFGAVAGRWGGVQLARAKRWTCRSRVFHGSLLLVPGDAFLAMPRHGEAIIICNC